MSSFVKTPTPNSRLLYIRQPVCRLSEWQSALERVESAIGCDLGVEEANSSIYLYFFAPSEQWTSRQEYWIGREIVGIVRGKSEEVAHYDLDRGYCYRAVLGYFPKDWDILLEREGQLREAYRDEYARGPATTWRINFDSEAPEKIFLEFFEKR